MSDHSTEIWKDIPEYEGYYQVSNWGRVKSLARRVKKFRHKGFFYQYITEKILKPVKHSAGYRTVSINQSKTYIHQLVALAFIPNPNNKPEVNHKNLDKSDNRVDNLEWVTKSENTNHAISNGIQIGGPKGSINKKSKLKETDVPKIIKYLNDGISERKVAALFNISKGVVHGIKNGKRWSHVARSK